MSKQTYAIINSSGKKVGVLFLDVDSPPPDSIASKLFESVTSGSPFSDPVDQPTFVHHDKTSKSFWGSDGITFAIAGIFTGGTLTIFSWAYNLHLGAWTVVGALCAGLGLHVAKILAHRPPASPQAETQRKVAQHHKITIETVTNNGHSHQILIDDFDPESGISLDDLQAVARAWVAGTSFARLPMCKASGISQGKFRLIKSEFERLHLSHMDKGNRNHLSLRGKSLLRQIASQD